MGQRLNEWAARALWAMCAAVLVACGSGSGEEVPATVGSDGGVVSAEGGVQVVVPPGAIAQDVTIRMAQDSTGAPPVPAWTQPAGPIVAITPHGAEFTEDVAVRLPVPAGLQLQPNQRLLIAKAQPGGEWEVLGDTVTRGTQLEAKVRSFSFFMPVVVSYLPIPGVTVQPLPYAFSAMTLQCDGAPCANPELLRRIPMTVTVTPNGGLLPASCVDPRIGLWQDSPTTNGTAIGLPEAVSSGSVFTRSFSLGATLRTLIDRQTDFYVRLICTDPATNARSYFTGASARLTLRGPDTVHRAPQVVQFPGNLQKAPGEPLSLRSVLVHGASIRSGTAYVVPTATDQARVFLERKEAADTVWRTVRTVTQTQANSRPLAGSIEWALWGYDFDLGTTTAADNGAQFRLRACYRAPTATAETCNIGPLATLTVLQHTVAPSFTQQPRALLVQPGQTASFNVLAVGTPAPALRWQTRAANDTGAWVDVSDGSGGDTASYTTPALRLADNGRQYRVVASNAAGTVPSETVTVSLSDGVVAPSIALQPASLTVVTGSEAVFAVSAKGTAALSYQWMRNGVDLAGANAEQLKLPAVQPTDAATYAVRVSNGAGSVTSADAVLRVSLVPTSTPAAPAIVTPPAAVAVNEGNVATFAVGVTGSGPMTFQWRRNGVDVPGATAAAFTMATVTLGQAGDYSVVVRNSVGSVTSAPATLAVVSSGSTAAPPVITTQPVSVVVVPASTTTLAVSASGSAPLRYQWFQDGAPVAGAIGPTLTLGSLDAISNGNYTVTVSNAQGSVTSNPATLTVVGAPAITTQPAPASAVDGGTARFSVAASGSQLRYQWLRNGEAIPGASAAAHTTPALSLADHGAVYSVVVYNGAGVAFSGGAVLTVSAAPPAAVTVLSLDFEAGYPPNVDVGDATLVPVQGFAGLGPTSGTAFAGSMLRSRVGNTVTITLTNLPAHQWLSLDFLFAAIDSLDGTGTFPAGDFFRVTVDGVDVFRESFANASTSQIQSYVPPAGVQLARQVDLGFGGPGGFFTDSAYWMGGDPVFARIAHTASSVTITFVIEGVGAQDVNDESWGIDNLRVVVGP